MASRRQPLENTRAADESCVGRLPRTNSVYSSFVDPPRARWIARIVSRREADGMERNDERETHCLPRKLSVDGLTGESNVWDVWHCLLSCRSILALLGEHDMSSLARQPVQSLLQGGLYRTGNNLALQFCTQCYCCIFRTVPARRCMLERLDAKMYMLKSEECT